MSNNSRSSSGNGIWIFIIFIILASMCERLDSLEKKINDNSIIETVIP